MLGLKGPVAGALALMLGSLGYIGYSLLQYARGEEAAEQAFGLINLYKASPPFSDLLWVIVVGKCGTNTARLFDSVAAVCDLYGYGKPGGGYVDTGYPPMANALVRILDISVTYEGAIGVAIGIFFLITVMASSRHLFRSDWAWPLSMAVVLVCFPVQLLLERANLDAIVYLLMVGASVLVAFGGGWMTLLLLPLVFMAVSLKAFPLFGFIGWLLSLLAFRSRGYSAGRFVKLLVCLGCVLGGVYLAPWAVSTGRNIEFSGGLASFGLRALGYINNYIVGIFGLDHARLLIRGLLVLKLTSIALGVILAVRATLPHRVVDFLLSIRDPIFRKYSFTYFLLMSWTWLGSYIVTISFDYKHVFLLPSVLVFWAMLDHRSGLSQFQFFLLLALTFTSLIIILIPLLAHAQLITGEFLIRLSELFGEVVFIPFYAASLGTVIGMPLLKALIPARFARTRKKLI